MRPRPHPFAEMVTLRGTSFLKGSPPSVRMAIARVDMDRFRADGWDIYDFGSETIALRELPLLDGDIGLTTALNSDNCALARMGRSHNGGGCVEGFVFVGRDWRTLDLDGLCYGMNRYSYGIDQLNALNRVQRLLARRAGTQLEFSASAFRLQHVGHPEDLGAAERY